MAVIFIAALLWPAAAIILAIGIYRVCLKLIKLVAKIAAKISAACGPFAWIIFAFVSIVFSVSIKPVVEALAFGKGLYIGLKRSKWGWPYGVTVNAQ